MEKRFMPVSQYIHAIRLPFEISVAPGVRVARLVYSCIVFGEGIATGANGIVPACIP